MALFFEAVSSAIHRVYIEIEERRNPHIFSKLSGKDLDDTGWFFNMPRQEAEGDASYLERLMGWTYSMQRSNETAIQNALQNLSYSSFAKLIPLTHGAGTGTIYVIPKKYEKETINNAFSEIRERMEDQLSKGYYLDYVVPHPEPVVLTVRADFGTSDQQFATEQMTTKIREYINSLAPYEVLELGRINEIGVNYPGVRYFQVIGLSINGKSVGHIRLQQKLQTKMLLDQIAWVTEGS